MKSIKESIIGRKGSNALDPIINRPTHPSKFNKDKAYNIMGALFHHNGASLIKTPAGIQKVYNNPSLTIQKLGNWCAPKDIQIFQLTISKRFINQAKSNLQAICVEYTFQGDEFGNRSNWDLDALASVISDGLSIMPEFRNTIIFIFSHVRDGYEYKDPLYIANPNQSKKPIRLNDILGDDKVDDIISHEIF